MIKKVNNVKRKKPKTDNKSTSKTNIDAYREADSITKSVEVELKAKNINIIKNATIYLSLLSIYLMALLYSYDQGLYAVYNIPVSYSNIDLRRFLPLLVSGLGASVYLGYYVGSWKYHQIFKKNSYRFLRVFWGCTFLITVLNQYINNATILILISVLIPTILEIIFTIMMSYHFKEIELSPDNYMNKVENYVVDWFLFFYIKKPIVAFIIISIILAPFCGRYTAYHKTKYETLRINNFDYVIVSEVGDNAYIEAFEMSNGYAIIHTEEYMRISINDTPIRIIEFDKVVIE